METEQEKTKRCPMCGEEILAIAIKCRHCGSRLDVRDARSRAMVWARSRAGVLIIASCVLVGAVAVGVALFHESMLRRLTLWRLESAIDEHIEVCIAAGRAPYKFSIEVGKYPKGEVVKQLTAEQEALCLRAGQVCKKDARAAYEGRLDDVFFSTRLSNLTWSELPDVKRSTGRRLTYCVGQADRGMAHRVSDQEYDEVYNLWLSTAKRLFPSSEKGLP